jgi:SRSO17 transposase
MVDDTALAKNGEHSLGVVPQYAPSLGKTPNCQSPVSLTLASREVPIMEDPRLGSWLDSTLNPLRTAVGRSRPVRFGDAA